MNDAEQRIIERAIQESMERLDAASDEEHSAVLDAESDRMVQVLVEQGVTPDNAEAVLAKLREIEPERRAQMKDRKMLERIQSAEKSMFSRGFARSALSRAQVGGLGAAMQIENELWPRDPQLPIVTQVPEEESRHGAFAMEHASLRAYADEESHDATFVRAISKLAGLSARRGGFTVDREVLEDAERTVSADGGASASGVELATRPQGIEASRKVAAAVAKKMGTDLAGLRKIWQQDFDDLCNWARALAKQWAAPPMEHLVTAANVESYAMAVIHFTSASADCPWVKDGSEEERVTIWDGIADQVPEFDRVRARAGVFYRRLFDDSSATFHAFGISWRESSYARLEIGHKLAASLCLTDTDAVEVQSPWLACSIVVPDGLFPQVIEDGMAGASISRLWCLNAQVALVVLSNGGVIANPEGALGAKVSAAIDSLARGAFLALENPDEFKKKTSSSSSSKNKRHGPPDMAQARYMLSAPISIDLRDALHEHLSGKRKGGGGAPKVQFLVRGHWRQQAHGPGRALRRKTWIKPFWKGPEESRVLLRAHKLKGGGGNDRGGEETG